MFGFVDYNFDIVVKFGGRILENPAACASALEELRALAQTGVKMLVYPGGGPTDLTLESMDKTYGFSDATHYQACLLAQDQMGLMIADTTVHPGFAPCTSLEEALNILEAGSIPVLLPSQLLNVVSPCEKIWAITSDSMAAWVCWLVGCKKLVVLKNVDGVFLNFDDPDNRILLENITSQELIDMRVSAVDECFGGFIKEKQLDTYIINATRASEIQKALAGERFFGTRVTP